MLVVNLPSVKRYKRHVVEGEPRYARWPRRLVVCARYTFTHTHTQGRGEQQTSWPSKRGLAAATARTPLVI